jgi:hypothetical protein
MENEKCSLCGNINKSDQMLELDNGEYICVKCYEILPKNEQEDIKNNLKLENGAISQKNIDLLLGFLGNDIFNDDIWNLNFKLQELRDKIEEPPYEPIYINNVPIYKNRNLDLLKENNIEEKFRHYKINDKITNVEVSNFGRIKLDDEILPQYNIYDSYLFINLPFSVLYYKPHIPDKVYRLVAETFLQKPSKEYNIVHHLTNNGYDNRLSNLIWVNHWQHLMIHPELPVNFNDKYFSIEILEYMIICYKYINVTQNDKNRILQIEKRLIFISNGNIKEEIQKIINELK